MAMGFLDGKVALVTGGARGQGRAHAVTCAREGADVIVVDVTKQVADLEYPLSSADDHAETVRQIEALDRRVVAVDADVRDQGALDEVVARGIAELGQIDILIANAGIMGMKPFWELSEHEWTEMIDVNLTGVWKSIKAVTPHMISRLSGSIVVTGSLNAIEPGQNYAHYTAAKHGVLGLMKTVALELGPYGIRCNAICPGPINTVMARWSVDQMFQDDRTTDEHVREAGWGIGVLRGSNFLEPQVMADAALFLNSPLAASVTGHTLPVESGHLLIPGVNFNPIKD